MLGHELDGRMKMQSAKSLFFNDRDKALRQGNAVQGA
jgi:hypothetical protein